MKKSNLTPQYNKTPQIHSGVFICYFFKPRTKRKIVKSMRSDAPNFCDFVRPSPTNKFEGENERK